MLTKKFQNFIIDVHFNCYNYYYRTQGNKRNFIAYYVATKQMRNYENSAA